MVERGRDEIILDALGKGTPIDKIDAILRREEHQFGLSTENNFVRQTYSCIGWTLESVQKASILEDTKRGIDFWLKFKHGNPYPYPSDIRLPVQVKSSKGGIDKFRNSQEYQAVGKKILVINARKGISNLAFKKEVVIELKRIRKLLTNKEDGVHS
jgi:hypothetical protein